MHEALSILKENWEQANALKLLALLARRLVSCGHNAVKDRTIGFLKEARKVCFSWMEDIQLKLQDASEPGRISDLQDCLLRVSAIQCNTFDIDPDYFPKMFGSKEDVVEFLACQIIVYENCMGVLSKLPKDLKFLLMTTRRFALSAERYIHEFIRRDSRILSDVLCIVLPTQERSGTWQQVQSPADRWWRFTSFGRRGSRVTVIHLDIIQGRLLIDGQPNGRLPSEYLTNTSYIKLLKTMVLDVMPSTMGDMSYQTTKHLNGFVLHFHLEDSHLIIRKVDEEGRAHEYIPGEKFDGEIPRPLVEAGSQWLDLDRGEVEFYQSSDSWTSGLSQKDWLLRQDNGGGWVMGRGTSKLLDIAGNIHAAVGKALQPIEASEYIITTVDRDTKINVDLPQYGLKFFVNQSNEIECDSLKGWVVDRLQSPGTFIGLRSFLKLKSENKYSTKECVLVPFGSIKTTLPVAGNHSEVEICPAANREYTVYQLDKSLNRVLDNGSLQARYTRIYLHCVTSGILADPLTGRTGIDEALDLLRNAASYSFQELTGPEASILDKVACLTPSRNFYPEHLRNMQTVCWADNVPTWVQHDELHPAVQAIFEDWNRRQFLAIGSECQKITKIGTPDLLERARNNNSVFRCGDPCAVDRRSAVTLHTLRHQVTDREAQTQDISRASFGWHEKQDLDINFTSGLMAKSSLPGYDGLSRLRYGPEWFGVAPSDRWCTLYELCRRATVQDRFGLLFIFSAFVYQGLADRPFLKSLLAIATSGSFTSLPIPHHRRFELGVGLKPSSRDIQILLQSSACSYRESPYYHPLLDIGIDIDIFRIDQYQSFARKYSDYETELEEQAENAAALIVSQWPSLVVVCPQGSFSLLNIPSTLDNIQIKFQACYQNHEFSTHLNTVIEKLWSLRGGKDTLRPFKYPRMRYSHKYMNGLHKSVPSLRQLLEERRVPESLLVPTLTPYTLIHDEVEIDNELNIERVITVANNLRDCSEMFAEEYSDSLLTSIKALQGSISCRGLQEIPITLRDSMREHHREAIENVEGLLRNIRNVLSPITELERLQETCGLWPDINKLQLLHRLRLIERRSLPASWQKAIIVLGEAITWEQRAGRLVEYAHDDLVQEFDREVRNPGRQNWNVVDYIDWLLLELDSEMLIRPVQATIGLSMMDDSEDKNAVMQLNMGEGKSAMILPAVAAALADTTRLVRPIVLKPLSTQMFQILVQRLSGLCDRRIYLLPIWRTAPLSREMVQVVRQLYEDCMNTGGIMLTLPEHILSFKLMGIEKMLRKEPEVSEPLIACQKWLTANARDILDESDEILHTRYQLIYTMGNQQALEGNKDRWAVVQELLDFVQERAIEAASQHPTAIEVGPIKGVRYRTIRIIDRAFGERMLQKITNDICMCDGRKVPSVSSKLKLLRPSTRKLAQRFMSMSEIAIKEQETLLEECNHIRTQLMVLRGLVAHGLLLFVLRDKRYRVDYGLDRTRSSLAVPYRAKDRPAVKAEFGHPEVMLILTCLSYYYGGLQNDDLQSCFELIGKSDNPELVYEHWTKRHPEVPSSLSKLRGINLLDLEQVQKTIFPFFRYNKSVIDFFLAELIFPREAKNFPYKLSTSAWDIVEKGGHNTTGFSGTNDNRRLLPTSIQQLDLPEQTHTNSLVLKHILLEENSTVFKIHRDGRRLEADEMIAEIVGLNPKVRVTLDVGAQILELNNQEVAQTWLKHEKSSEILGAVYFGDNDKLLVMKRNGKIEPFTSSALSKQLDRVLVFLDEAHTRGTDLKLPVNTRAAVTLGPNLPKDKFVQGCMRMRKLGNGHSLVFLAPPDIYTHVQISAGKNTGQEIDTSDVLLWTMIESCRQIQHGFSIWADQGLKYLERSVAWGQFKENKNVSQLRRVIMEAESRPLEEMYGVGGQGHQFGLGVTNSKEGIHIFQQLDQFDVKMTRSVAIHEEQEREVDHEVEVEIHKELPGPAKSNDHSLHPDVMALAASGVFNEKSEAFSLAYDVYKQTSAKSLLEYRAWKSSLYATKDFLETIKIGPFGKMDNFLRPVRWILSVQDCSKLILLSPYEANELMPVIRKGTACCLHCYSPRVTQTMRTLEFLDLCATPALPQTPRPKPSLEMRISLNIFAGQLFFHDEGYYRELCQFLGLYYGEIDGALQRKADGWINTRTRRALCLQGTDAGSKFARSPIPFLSEAIKMRRKGQGFSLTHLGSVLNARTLGVEDF
ncbi:hypothetical protein DRE_02972 [Drechslerella stenobrocha 248]|uniref:ubiquitinyl hydrolase 1 n=1 Tax=Drechslerella stenobrocha 248 TaxID=1043628 RepID=W7I5M8_9PEZI|nr:hypothetical protein DRE_02972 [Drechslerella stenobrocha 248]